MVHVWDTWAAYGSIPFVMQVLCSKVSYVTCKHVVCKLCSVSELHSYKVTHVQAFSFEVLRKIYVADDALKIGH